MLKLSQVAATDTSNFAGYNGIIVKTTHPLIFYRLIIQLLLSRPSLEACLYIYNIHHGDNKTLYRCPNKQGEIMKSNFSVINCSHRADSNL